MLSSFAVSFSTAAGDGVPAAVMSKQTPIIFLAVAPEYNALSDDMTATAAHYSGQPLGLLKDVMLSVLPFKAGGKTMLWNITQIQGEIIIKCCVPLIFSGSWYSFPKFLEVY